MSRRCPDGHTAQTTCRVRASSTAIEPNSLALEITHADKLRADQEAAIKAATRAEVLGQLQQEIVALAPEARDLVLSALGKAVKALEP
jgi:hypothetical protein